MFHGFGKPKFYKKSKSLLKILKTRLDTIKKKKNAVLKFMKDDIADLLRNNLDMNAYGRAEGLLVELDISSCYDIIEQCVMCISGQVSAMLKQTECPNECREAIPTLIYAAARFADLPELRELRSLFTEKYGNSLDSYVIKEFVERLKAIPPAKEIKLQLLQDIAREFSIEWDSKALQQKLYTPPPPPPPAQHNPKHDESKQTKRRDDEYNVPSSSEDEVGSNFRRDSTSQDSRKTSSSSVGSVSEDEADNKKPFYYRPPYVRNNNPAQEKSTYGEITTNAEKNNRQDPPADNKKPRSVRKNKLKPPPGQEVNGDDETKAKQARQQARQHAQALLNDNGEESDEENKMDNLLMHYSKKKEPQETSNTGGAPRHRSGKSELPLPPGRASSVPTEMKAKNEPFRTKSMEEDLFNQHVHPKLPDYDDLAARIAALRGK
ncbi:hypothetical protein QYF36_004843 [Acer negundo]|nr:hypothetical protein QYF36_004843 [Acer negundo]